MKMMTVRSLTATVLFLVLAKLNIWSDTGTHLVLAVGYRAFLLCAPVFLILGLSRGMRASLFLCLAAVFFAAFKINAFSMGLLAVGMAVSGYLAKYVAAHTSRGAADNKVSLNVGSLLSGILLMLPFGQSLLLAICGVLLAVACVVGMRLNWEAADVPAPEAKSPSKKLEAVPMTGWALIGIATGIKLTGIFTVLPRYLMTATGDLPSWFGALIIVNSALVVLVQHRVLDFLDRAPRYLFASAVSTMLVLAMPAVLRVERFGTALVWVVLLTFGECALSRYDRTAREAGYLFPKELMVGAGSFVTVWLSRSFPHAIHWSGWVGAISLTIGVLMTSPWTSSLKSVTGYARFRRRTDKGISDLLSGGL